VCLIRSKRLATYRNLVFHHKPFSTAGARDFILAAKNIMRASPLLVGNLNLVLRDLRIVNILILQLETERKVAFDKGRSDHQELLVALWTAVCPTQQYPGPVGPHWDIIGFQGHDPSTDFRGMGVLCLKQLVYLARESPEGLKRLLTLSQGQGQGVTSGYFPFGATSVVISSFFMHLLRENRLHAPLLTALSDQSSAAVSPLSSSSSSSSSSENSLAENLLSRYNALFVHCWLAFADLWEQRRGQSVMDFPGIFAVFQAEQKRRWVPLQSVRA